MVAHEHLIELAARATDRQRRAALSAALQRASSDRERALRALLSQWNKPGIPRDRAGDNARSLDILCIGDARYPVHLSATPDPPPILFYRGQPELLARPCVAIVGSRKALPSSLALAKEIAADLARLGVAVVSGLARGVDGAAHIGALDATRADQECRTALGGTVAVLGAGLDRIYPSEHAGLFARIAESGLLLTEYRPGVRPYPSHFPQRNRIISGLARAIVVIEAGAQSGSLGTAREALEQGREVLVVPGPVQGGRFAGSHKLLRDGAVLVETASDVLEAAGVISIEDVGPSALAASTEAAVPQSEDATRVLECCVIEGAGTGFEAISVRVGLPIAAVRALVAELEVDGFVVQSSHGYIRCK